MPESFETIFEQRKEHEKRLMEAERDFAEIIITPIEDAVMEVFEIDQENCPNPHKEVVDGFARVINEIKVADEVNPSDETVQAAVKLELAELRHQIDCRTGTEILCLRPTPAGQQLVQQVRSFIEKRLSA